MKFWLNRETDFIYLDQLIKATGLMDDYKEIMKVIHDGKIKVNGETALQRRKSIYEGDRVRFGKNFIQVVGSREAQRLAELKEEPKGKIEHGKQPNKWKSPYAISKKKKK